MSAQAVIGVILLAAGVVAALFALTAFLIGRGDRHDPFAASGLTASPAEDPGMVMPPQIACEPPWDRSVAGPPSSPAAPPPTSLGGAPTQPGTAAAAGPYGATPPASPPPLPESHITELARTAITDPEIVPFPVWQLDEFVETYNAIKGGA